MYRLTGKRRKEKTEVICTPDYFTAEYTKMMREGYLISVENIGMDVVRNSSTSNGEDNE